MILCTIHILYGVAYVCIEVDVKCVRVPVCVWGEIDITPNPQSQRMANYHEIYILLNANSYN